MFEVVLDKSENFSNIVSIQEVTYLTYDCFRRNLGVITERKAFVNPDVYEWLLLNVGEETKTFRELDRTWFDEDSYRDIARKFTSGITDMAHWDQVNPIVPHEKRLWTTKHNFREVTLQFVSNTDAVHFKLNWF